MQWNWWLKQQDDNHKEIYINFTCLQ